MALYYVNKNAQTNGDHEVHKSDCTRLPDLNNRQYLGDYSNCTEAVKKAKNVLYSVKRVLLLINCLSY
jgi:hypothetical protein